MPLIDMELSLPILKIVKLSVHGQLAAWPFDSNKSIKQTP